MNRLMGAHSTQRVLNAKLGNGHSPENSPYAARGRRPPNLSSHSIADPWRGHYIGSASHMAQSRGSAWPKTRTTVSEMKVKQHQDHCLMVS
jgi:hypothetical protein